MSRRGRRSTTRSRRWCARATRRTLFSEDGRRWTSRSRRCCEGRGAIEPADGQGVSGERRHGLTIATAESCTGGLLVARLTELPGASDYVRGGIVAYANDVEDRPGGSAGRADRTLRRGLAGGRAALARGARERLAADIGVGVTGIAGPDGGSEEKPVGLVCLSVVGPGDAASDALGQSAGRARRRARPGDDGRAAPGAPGARARLSPPGESRAAR